MTRRKEWLMGVILVLGVFVAYQPVWHAGFIWDDDSFLTDNPVIKAGDGLYRLWCTISTPDYFPLTSSTLWLEWRLWGLHAAGYHLVNILLHALSAVLLWRVLQRLKVPGAWLAAGLFALHPVNVESVAWITERKNTLCMFFYMAALWAWLKHEDEGGWRWYGMALGAFALSLLSKTASAPLPLVLLGLAWWRRGRVQGKDVSRVLPFFGVAAILALVTIWFQYHESIGREIVRADSAGSRLAGAGWAVWFYLYKTIWPVDLMFVYPRWQIDAHNVLSYVPLALLVLVFVLSWRYSKAVFFALGYFVVLLLPVLGFLNIYFMRYSLVADHWQYFAIIGPLALAGAWTRKPALGALLLLVLGVLTWKQCGLYADAETLWQTTLRQNPNSWMIYDNLASLYLGDKHWDESVASSQKALDINPNDAEADDNLGLALVQQDRTDEAIAFYRKALAIDPEDAKAHVNLGNALDKKGEVDEAISQYQRALEINPNMAQSHNDLGAALMNKGRVDEAISQYEKALAVNPDYVSAHLNLGTVLFLKARTADAMAQFEAVLQIEPDNVEAQKGLAWMLATCADRSLRDGDKAVALARRADTLTGGNDPLILRILAAALAETGRFSEAAQTAQRALSLPAAQSDAQTVRELQGDLTRYQAGLPFQQ